LCEANDLGPRWLFMVGSARALEPQTSGRGEILQVKRQWRPEGIRGVFEIETQGGSVEGLARQKKLGLERRGPIGFDEFEVTVFVGTVNLVADNRMSDVGEMNPDLMGAAGLGFGSNQGVRLLSAFKSVQDAKGSEGRVAVGMDGLFQPDFGGLHGPLPQEGLIHNERFGGGPAVDNRGIGFPDPALSDH
jgi:hypothetical protein